VELGEFLFKALVFCLIAYGVFSIITGETISDPEDGKMHMIRRQDDPRTFWVHVGCLFVFAGMMVWAGYIYGPSQVRKQNAEHCMSSESEKCPN
jgi:hypothetical protein